MPTPAPGDPVAWPGRTACGLRRPMPIPAPGDHVDTEPCPRASKVGGRLRRPAEATADIEGVRRVPAIAPARRHPAARSVIFS